MSERISPPRWGDALDSDLGRLFEAGREPGLPEGRLGRIRLKLRGELRPPSRRSRWFLAALAVSGTALGAAGLWRARWRRPGVEGPAAAPRVGALATRMGERVRAERPPLEEPPVREAPAARSRSPSDRRRVSGPAASERARVTVPRQAREGGPVPNASAPPGAGVSASAPKGAVAPPDDPTADEAVLLATALSALNRDPRGALALLDRYAQRFPSGTLSREARGARVQGLLARGAERAALQALDAAGDPDFADYPRSAELRLLRGELLGRQRRCREALSTFAGLLADDLGKTVNERALAGLARCMFELGDREGGRRAWTSYLQEFPRGSSAELARQALGE